MLLISFADTANSNTFDFAEERASGSVNAPAVVAVGSKPKGKRMRTATSQSHQPGDTVHKFELAGLGKAPFHCVSVVESGTMTSCDYCSTGIKILYWIAGADGRHFKVGCDCVRKTGDAGLIKIVTEKEAERRRKANKARQQAKWAKEADQLQAFADGKCKALKNQPHPKGREGTAYDYVDWCISNRCVGYLVYHLIGTVYKKA